MLSLRRPKCDLKSHISDFSTRTICLRNGVCNIVLNVWTRWRSRLSTASVAWESADWKTQLGLPTLTLDPGEMEGTRRIDGHIYSFILTFSCVAVNWSGMSVRGCVHVGFHENKQEFTTHICLNPTFIMCFIKICMYGNLNFDLWSSGLTFF